ncbi:MAG: alpha/beta hydrolase family protein [Bryobacteraceae bacterium]
MSPLLALLCLSPELARLYDYDRSAPLDMRQHGVETRDGIVVRDITYASPRGGRVPAYLVRPPGSGPFAAIVILHGGGENRSTFLPEALALARLGAVCLTFDALGRKDRAPSGKDPVEDGRDDLLQAAVDARRAADLLRIIPGVDHRPVGYIGHSFGAMLGANLAAVDKRFGAMVLITGVIGFTHHAATSPAPFWVKWRQDISQEKQKRYQEVMAPLDARHYLPSSAPTKLLFQASRRDAGVPEQDSLDFAAAAQQPKELRWYDDDHALRTPAAVRDRVEWLRQALKLR